MDDLTPDYKVPTAEQEVTLPPSVQDTPAQTMSGFSTNPGTVTGATLRTSDTNPKFQMDNNTFQGINASNVVTFEVVIAGTHAGDVTMGSVATGSYAKWDNVNGTFKVFGDNVPQLSQGFFGGDGTDGALSITSGTTTIDCGSATTLVKNYQSISITGTGALAFSNPHANGTTIILKSLGAVTITSSTTPCIDASGMGAAGGPFNGGSTISTGAGGSSSSVGTAGTDGKSFSEYKTNTGAAGTTDGTVAAGGAVASFEAIRSYSQLLSKYQYLIPGAGGGSGAARWSSWTSGTLSQGVVGLGGRGGGVLIIECAGALNFTTANGISVAGANAASGQSPGGSGTGMRIMGGAGGGAGQCLIIYNDLTSKSGTINVSGGAKGSDFTSGTGGALNASNGGGGGSVYAAGSSSATATGASGASNMILNETFA